MEGQPGRGCILLSLLAGKKTKESKKRSDNKWPII